MPFYFGIDRRTPEGRRTAQGLLRLRKQMESPDDPTKRIPDRTISDTLLLATWNIREFDSAKYGPRLSESFYYMAEIISHFDLVAVQEVREDMDALGRLQKILGGWWHHVVTDVTAGRRGNRERLAFLYDTRKVRFSGLAGEIVLPPKVRRGKPVQPVLQLARTPFVCGFTAGWAKFNLCTVHILYGTKKRDDPQRVREIEELCKFLARRAKQKTKHPENLILLGDFNIFGRQDVTMNKLLDAGFRVPPELQEIPGTNVPKDKTYDQIAFMVRRGRLKPTGKANVFDFFESVFTNDEERVYLPIARQMYKEHKGKTLAAGKWPSRSFRSWRTYQMSDHLPLWVELQIDFGAEYLQTKVGG